MAVTAAPAIRAPAVGLKSQRPLRSLSEKAAAKAEEEAGAKARRRRSKEKFKSEAYEKKSQVRSFEIKIQHSMFTVPTTYLARS